MHHMGFLHLACKRNVMIFVPNFYHEMYINRIPSKQTYEMFNLYYKNLTFRHMFEDLEI